MKNKTDTIALLTLGLITSFALSGCEEKSTQDSSSEKQTMEVIQSSDISLEVENVADEQASEESAQPESSQQEESVEMIPNPQYAAWAKFSVGTTVVLENRTESEEEIQSSITFHTLTEVTEENLTYEIKTTSQVNGQEIKLPVQQQVIPAKISSDTPIRPADMPGVTLLDESTVEITLGDKVLVAKKTIFETTGGEGDDKFKSQTTLLESEEVPGALVEMTQEISKNNKTIKTSTRVIQVIETQINPVVDNI